MTALAPTLEAFFTGRLVKEKGASPNTIASYRDTFRLLLSFAQQHTGKPPCKLEIEDLDAPLISAFLDQLEHSRANSPRTRNTRLAAIHSMFRYAALRHPEHAGLIARVLAVPAKRFDRTIVSYLTPTFASRCERVGVSGCGLVGVGAVGFGGLSEAAARRKGWWWG
jgi:integrase/recombinase XerD